MISLDVKMLHKCYLQDDCSARLLNISGASGDPLMQSEVMGAATATTAGSGVTDFMRQKASKGISSVATVATHRQSVLHMQGVTDTHFARETCVLARHLFRL